MTEYMAKKIEALRESYPIGSEVRLVFLDDMFGPPSGTVGVIKNIDENGSLYIDWGPDYGVISVIPGIDKIELLKEERT